MAGVAQVCCILGPRGAGKNVLAAQLLRDFPTKVTADPTTMMDEEVNDLDPPEKRPESGKVSFFYEEKHRKASAAAPLGDVNSTSDRGLPGLGGAAAAAAAAAEAAAVAGVAPSDEDRRGVLHPKDFNQLVTAGQLLAPHVDEDGSTIAYSLVGLEASWEQQVIPLVTGSWELGQQLMKELPGDVQVVVIFVDAPTVDLDQRMRSKGRLGEADLQAHLADAEVQRAACAAFMATQAAVRAGSEEVSAVVQQLLARVECYTVDNSGQLGHAYAAAKEVLAAHWHAAAPQLYGLLLVEPQPLRAPDGSLPAGGVSIQEEVELPETSTVVSDPAQGEAGESHKALSRTKAAGLGVPHAWLRLRATTAAGAMLELSRGRHLLRLLAPEHLVHTIRLSSRTPFSVGEASKVLPAAGCGHVLVQEGEHEAWLPGTYQVLFR
jgi:ribose 1,5-bisphosphokinase PhnN